MTKHLDRDIERLQKDILSLCTTVEEMINKAAQAFCEGRMDLAQWVLERDSYVDQQEVLIEEECLKLLALHHPVAAVLRRITMVIKVNNDLERIADLAVSVAQRAQGLSKFPNFVIPTSVEPMVGRVTEIVRAAMDAFVCLDTQQAREVIAMDEMIDDLNVELITSVTSVMQSDSQMVPPALHCFSAIRNLERIADLATNIAEDAIYLVEGEIVRHSIDL